MLPFPLPADVAAAMGWNQLPQGSPKGKRGADTIIESGSSRIASNQQANVNQLPARHHMKELSGFQTEIARLAARMKKPHIASADARFPIFVLLTSREGLEAQYGIGHVAEIDKALQQAVKTCRKMRHWDACLIYADDAKSAEVYGIAPADSNAPWALKNFIKDLDEAMRQRGEMIGALLLVGGAQVVPFHNLPNPVDDMDTEVPSDNPYATADENYFIPSWPVGRLPGSSGNNPQPLIDQIHGMIQVREKSYKKTNLFTRWLQNLLHRTRKRLSFGYTAEVWRRASNSVFRPIGKPHTMVISPPVGSKLIGKYQKQASKLAYYNLHGLEDTSEWYGQRDPLETTSGEDYPVALRPQDIVNSGRAPQIVFSEACYGGHILGKRVEDAIVLKFLASGTQAVVGSTCTSYGSITTPLISADLLGKLFWNYLKEGYAAGPALQRAKIELARQMDKRQGYLDGEDQKTLISFVLYGDPLAQAPQFVNGAKSSKRLLPQVGKINIICDKSSSNEAAPLQISQEVMSQVKGVVRQYLPGMAGARIQISAEHTHCNGHNCPTNQIGGGSQLHARRRVVTLSKSIKAGRLSHPYFARITLNEKGKVVKLAVSR